MNELVEQIGTHFFYLLWTHLFLIYLVKKKKRKKKLTITRCINLCYYFLTCGDEWRIWSTFPTWYEYIDLFNLTVEMTSCIFNWCCSEKGTKIGMTLLGKIISSLYRMELPLQGSFCWLMTHGFNWIWRCMEASKWLVSFLHSNKRSFTIILGKIFLPLKSFSIACNLTNWHI